MRFYSNRERLSNFISSPQDADDVSEKTSDSSLLSAKAPKDGGRREYLGTASISKYQLFKPLRCVQPQLRGIARAPQSGEAAGFASKSAAKLVIFRQIALYRAPQSRPKSAIFTLNFVKYFKIQSSRPKNALNSTNFHTNWHRRIFWSSFGVFILSPA